MAGAPDRPVGAHARGGDGTATFAAVAPSDGDSRPSVWPRRVASVAIPVLVCFLIALFLEVFVHNFGSVTTIGLEPVQPVEVAGMVEGDVAQLSVGGAQAAGEDPAVASFAFDGAVIDSLKLQVDGVEGAEDASVVVELVDEGHRDSYVIATESIEDLQRDPWLRIYPYGDVSEVRLRLEATPAEGATASVDLTVGFDEPIPFRITKGRVLVTTLLFCLAWTLRPSSVLYRVAYDDRPWLYVISAGLGVCLLLSCVRFRGASLTEPNWQFDALAQALLDGEVSVDYEVPPELLEAENPYDTAALRADGVDYKPDVAFYEGRYYVYFGPLPVLLFHLPYRALTGQALEAWVPVAICMLVLPTALARLLLSLLRRWRPQASLGLAILLYIALFVGTFSGYFAIIPELYVIPECLSLVLAGFGLSLWVDATTEGPISLWRAAIGGLLIALTLQTRLLFFAYAAFGVALLLRPFAQQGFGRCVPGALCAFAPMIVVIAATAWYNHVRFGSYLDFGAAYNLTISDLTHAPKGLWTAALGIYGYLFQPPNLSLAYPNIHATMDVQGYDGYLYSFGMIGGLCMIFPVLLTALLVCSRAVRRRMEGDAVVFSCIGIALSVALAAISVNNGGFALRYTIDCAFGFALAMIAVAMSVLGWRRPEGEGAHGRAAGRRVAAHGASAGQGDSDGTADEGSGSLNGASAGSDESGRRVASHGAVAGLADPDGTALGSSGFLNGASARSDDLGGTAHGSQGILHDGSAGLGRRRQAVVAEDPGGTASFSPSEVKARAHGRPLDQALVAIVSGKPAFTPLAVVFCALLAVSVIFLMVWWPWPWHSEWIH